MRAFFVAMLLAGCGEPARPKVVNAGHRGTGVSMPGNPQPENTLPSFMAALAEGAGMLELDVMHTKDGRLVIIHDEDTARTTGTRGCVLDQTLAELQQLDAGLGTPVRTRLPTLDEVLTTFTADLNVEIKVGKGDKGCPATDVPRLAADVVALLAPHIGKRRLVVSSFEIAALDEVKKRETGLELGYLTYEPDDAQVARAHGFQGLHLIFAAVQPETIAQIHAAGLYAGIWTVNLPSQMTVLLDDRADMIITDDPAALTQLEAQR
jgi:glycerophosphoryl diester phosphodiesterase